MLKAKRTTIRDVAKAANTGKTSVSRYLNGEENLLSEELKLRIKTAITELKYRPSQMARSLKHGKTRLIGLIIADLTNPYSIDVMGGVEEACRTYGYTLLICNTNNEADLEQHYIRLLTSYQVEGIIINAVGIQEDAIESLNELSTPVTLIDRKISSNRYDVVALDNNNAIQQITQHLQANGYQSLLYITEPIGNIHPRLQRSQTFANFIRAQSTITGSIAEVALHNSSRLEAVISEFTQQNSDKNIALICGNGNMTLQVTMLLKQMQLTWGSDIGLVGFDELNWSSLAGCGITTLAQPTFQIGYQAFEILLNRIKQTEQQLDDRCLTGQLIIRASSRNLAAKDCRIKLK